MRFETVMKMLKKENKIKIKSVTQVKVSFKVNVKSISAIKSNIGVLIVFPV